MPTGKQGSWEWLQSLNPQEKAAFDAWIGAIHRNQGTDAIVKSGLATDPAQALSLFNQQELVGSPYGGLSHEFMANEYDRGLRQQELRKQLTGLYDSTQKDIDTRSQSAIDALTQQAQAIGAGTPDAANDMRTQSERLRGLSQILEDAFLSEFDTNAAAERQNLADYVAAAKASEASAESMFLQNALALKTELANALAGGGGGGGGGGFGGGRRRFYSGRGGGGGSDGAGWDSTQINEGFNEAGTLDYVGLQQGINKMAGINPRLASYAQATFNRSGLDPIKSVTNLQGMVDMARANAERARAANRSGRNVRPGDRIAAISAGARGAGKAYSSSQLIPFFGGFTGRMGTPKYRQTTSSKSNNRATIKY